MVVNWLIQQVYRPVVARPKLLTAAFCLALGSAAWAETPLAGPAASDVPLNFPTATAGGQTFWTDELVHGGWRIQQNSLTGHYRLLDDKEFRRAWGTFDQCRAKFDELKRSERVPDLKPRVVVTMHGIIRSRDQMEGLGEYLQDQGDYSWINVTYASTRHSLDDHARALSRVIEHLDGIKQIDFVCHSLGNLVLRRYLGEAKQDQPEWQPDPRIGRIVMLGPPNNGAQLARYFKDNQLFAVVAGPSGKQLADTWDECQECLAVPSGEFGIIAGGQGSQGGFNPLVKGDDDLVVGVAETKLPGARDFRVLPCRHGNLVYDPHVRECVLCFLQHGYFTAAEERQPIEAAGR